MSKKRDKNNELQALGRKVKAAQSAHTPEIDEQASGWAIGIRYASDFSAAVIVAGFMGWAFDHFVGTNPWGLMVGIVLGFIAGTRNIIRTASELSIDDETPSG